YPAGMDRTAGPVQPEMRSGQISNAYFVFMGSSSLFLIRVALFESLLILVHIGSINSASWGLVDSDRENQRRGVEPNYGRDADIPNCSDFAAIREVAGCSSSRQEYSQEYEPQARDFT